MSSFYISGFLIQTKDRATLGHTITLLFSNELTDGFVVFFSLKKILTRSGQFASTAQIKISAEAIASSCLELVTPLQQLLIVRTTVHV